MYFDFNPVTVTSHFSHYYSYTDIPLIYSGLILNQTNAYTICPMELFLSRLKVGGNKGER